MRRRLAHKSDANLIDDLKSFRTTEIANTAELILHIEEVMHRDLHMEKSPSMYEYLKTHLNYSPNETYPRIRAAQALTIEPKLYEALKENRTCITHLMQAQKAFMQEDKRRKATKEPKLTLDEKRKLLNEVVEKQEAQQTIANTFPKLNPPVSKKQLTKDGGMILTISFTKEEVAELKRNEELLSHKVFDGNYHDLFMENIRFVNAKKDKLQQKAKTPDEAPTENQRKYISIHTKRKLEQNAIGQCEWQYKNGERCNSRHAIETDHKTPIAKGGTDSFHNLRRLCSAHNKYAAKKEGLHPR